MDRVQAIINTLLEFSRESKAELESVDVNDLIRKTLMLMNKYLQNSDVRVVTELAEIGPCTANQNALRQIFLNLITNAVQAMPHGGELRIRTARGTDNGMQLEFSDTGVGIPERPDQGHLQPVLHDEIPRPGHRARLVDRALGGAALPRRDSRAQHAERRHELPDRPAVRVRR